MDGMIDAAIIGLLVGVLCYTYTLSRRFNRLRQALGEIGPAIEAFSEAVDRSQASVESMREVSDDLSRRAAATQRSARSASPAGSKQDLINGFFRRGVRSGASRA